MFVSKNNCVKTGLVLFGGFIVHLALGSFFTFGNFAPYFISYIRNRTDDSTVKNIEGIWITSFGSLGNCIGFPLGGLFASRFNCRVATALGGLIFSCSLFASYFCVQQSLLAMIFVYGVTSSIGNFMAYGPPIQTAIRWMPVHPALAAGLIVAGFGGGATIFNQVITGYINPDNLSPDLITDDGDRYFTDPDLLDRVPKMFLILGGCYLGMILIGVLCLIEPPTTTTQVELNTEKDIDMNHHINNGYNGSIPNVNEKVANGSEVAIVTEEVIRKSEVTEMKNENFQKDLSMKEAVIRAFKLRSFYLVWLIVLCICCGMQFVFTLFKAYGQTFIEDDHFLSLVGSISSIFNCIGRPIWGAVMDKFGYRFTIRCITAGLAAFCGTLFLTERMPKELFAVWICAQFFFFCGTWSVTPTTLAKLFGPENMAVNYGFVNAAVAVGNILAGITGMNLKSRIGWHGIYFMSAGMNAVPFFLTFLFNGKDREGKRI